MINLCAISVYLSAENLKRKFSNTKLKYHKTVATRTQQIGNALGKQRSSSTKKLIPLVFFDCDVQKSAPYEMRAPSEVIINHHKVPLYTSGPTPIFLTKCPVHSGL